MLNKQTNVKQTVQTIGIQAEALEKRINMNKQRKLPKKDEWQNAESRSFDWFERGS